MDTSLADEVLGSTVSGSVDWLTMNVNFAVAAVLVAAFGIAVGFVAFKLIKRAINKA